MRPASTGLDLGGRVAAAYDVLRESASRLERVRPGFVLVPVVALQLAVVAAVALRADHNGWLYYTGGDGTHYWTASWALAHRWIPTAVASYGLPVLLWPLAYLVGDSLPAVLPPIVLVQVLVGGPLVVLALYGIASRIAGRLLGYVAAVGWAVAPLVTLGYFQGGFRGDIRNLVVPNALGLTNLADFPSLVVLTLAAWLLVRSFDTGAWSDVLLSSLLTGFALGIKPANAVFLPAPVLALAVARRWRHGAAFVLALLPAVATLTLWKWIGFGYVPGLSRVQAKSALGATPSLPLAAGGLDALPFSWHTFTNNLVELREVGWSVLLLEWIVVAGSFALIRKAPAKGTLVAVWFLGYVFLKGSAAGRSDVYQTTFFRLIEPAFPALVLLAAGCLLLVPTWGRRRGRIAPEHRRPQPTRSLAVGVVALAVYPLVIVGVSSATPPGKVVFQQEANQSVPVSNEFHLRLTHRDGHSVLSWQAPPAGATRVSYRVWRTKKLVCHYQPSGGRDCLLRMPSRATTRATSWTDPQTGTWTYRVSAMANEHRDVVGGDFVLFSPVAR
jgi:hypothetical protein